jgi:hypothetical protein
MAETTETATSIVTRAETMEEQSVSFQTGPRKKRSKLAPSKLTITVGNAPTTGVGTKSTSPRDTSEDSPATRPVDDSSISRVVEILQCFAKPAVLLDYSLEVR